MKNSIDVYIRTDGEGNVTAVNSGIFIGDLSGWVKIDEGNGDRYAHAQNNYFVRPLKDENGIYRYRFENGSVTEKTAEETKAEAAALPAAPPTEMELLKAQLEAVIKRNEFLEDCIAEMAVDVYKLKQ